MPKPKVALFGLTTEGYTLAAALTDKAEVTIVDETLQMAMDLNSAFLKKNPDLGALMAGEPLLSFKPIEKVLGEAEVIFFTPKLRRPSEETLIEAGTKLRELSKHLSKGVALVNTLPTGPGGNSENIMLVEKQTGLTVGDSLTYAYMPRRPGPGRSSIFSVAGETKQLEALGYAPNSQNIFSAELEYASEVIQESIGSVAEVELGKKAREGNVVMKSGKDVYVDDFARHLYDLRAIQASEEAGEPISYIAGATLKSLENYARYVVDETRDVLRDKELKAARTRISLLWSLDQYEMRPDRVQMAEGIQQRLRDYVTDVQITSAGTGREILDPLKHNVVIACSERDHAGLKELRGNRGAEITVIRATPSLARE